MRTPKKKLTGLQMNGGIVLARKDSMPSICFMFWLRPDSPCFACVSFIPGTTPKRYQVQQRSRTPRDNIIAPAPRGCAEKQRLSFKLTISGLLSTNSSSS